MEAILGAISAVITTILGLITDIKQGVVGFLKTSVIAVKKLLIVFGKGIYWVYQIIVGFFDWFLKFIKTLFQVVFDFLLDFLAELLSIVMDLVIDVISVIPGVDALAQIAGYMSNLPSDVTNIMGLIGLGTATGIIVTAIGIRLALQLIPFTRLGS